MKERIDNDRSPMKNMWDRICVKSKAQLRKLKPCCQRCKEALRKARKWLAHCSKELSANAQNLLLKTIEWFCVNTAKLVSMLLPFLAKCWLLLCGAALWLATKAKAMYQAIRSRKPSRLPAAPQEPEVEVPADVQPVEELPQVEIPEILPAAEPEIPTVVKAAPVKKDILHQIWHVLCIIGRVIRETVRWIWRLRGLLMSLPVAVVAIRFAWENMHRLPELVGVDIQASGEFARTISRDLAVLGPLGITAFCILLTVGSKKPLFPWVISVFSLVLPPLIWFLNYYA